MINIFPTTHHLVYIISIKSDGNCLYSSIARATNMEMLDLRKMVSYSILLPEHIHTVNFWRELYFSAQEEKDEQLLLEYNHMEDVKHIPLNQPLTLVDKKLIEAKMMGNMFWGEEFAFRILEKSLHIVILVINGHTRKLQESSNKIDYNESIRFVIVYLFQKHYNLISFNNKTIFSYKELPDDIKE
jgi:hypothetical protein